MSSQARVEASARDGRAGVCEEKAMTDHRLDSALIALRQILRATEISSRALAKSSGLTTSQHIVLQLLAGSNGMTQSELAREASLSHATVTALLERMTARGLVDRARDAADRRKILVRITDLGRETLESAPSLLQQRFEERFMKLAEWERAFLVAALERTVRLLDAEDLDAAPVLDIGTLTIGKDGE